jgi:hypothetical protein
LGKSLPDGGEMVAGVVVAGEGEDFCCAR